MRPTQRFRDEVRRRYSREEPKSAGKAYGCWVIGCFVFPGLHRFYLGRRMSGLLMVGLILAALIFAVIGFNAVYSPYLDMILGKPGAHGSADALLESAKPWFYAATGSAAGAYVWMVIDLFLIPRMAREP